MAGGVTVLNVGLVGRGFIGALVVSGFLVGFVVCLEVGFWGLAVVVLVTVDFDGFDLGSVDLEGVTLTGFDFDLGRVTVDGGALDLGSIFFAVVGCGFFRTPAWSFKTVPDLVLGDLVVKVAGLLNFFLSGPAVVFFKCFCGVGFGGVGLALL